TFRDAGLSHQLRVNFCCNNALLGTFKENVVAYVSLPAPGSSKRCRLGPLILNDGDVFQALLFTAGAERAEKRMDRQLVIPLPSQSRQAQPPALFQKPVIYRPNEEFSRPSLARV
ncbi:MAG: hypothetical protein SWE60_05730, partial [Thermodesulfobacteriota bacterium]|nr:hypothetical protein [Thermodesulfobacteriota bacterium]